MYRQWTAGFILCCVIASYSSAISTRSDANIISFPLHEAAQKNDRKTLQKIFKQGYNINTLDAHGNTALLVALENNHFKTADWLITKGTNLTLKNAHQQSALYLAIQQGSKAIAFRLIFGDFDPNDMDKNGVSVLDLAALKGWADVVEVLLDKGAKSPSARPLHKSPAYLAGKKGYIKVTKKLVKHQVPNPFFLAFYASPSAFQTALQQNKKSILAVIPDTGETFLHLACYGNNHNLAAFLITSGINMNQQDTQGQTALHIATAQGHLKLAQLLLKKGINKSLLDENAQTAWDIAHEHHSFKMMHLLQ